MLKKLDESVDSRLDMAIEKCERMLQNLKDVKRSKSTHTVATILAIALIRDIIHIHGLLDAKKTIQNEMRDLIDS